MIHNTFISEVEIFCPQRNIRPLSVIKENPKENVPRNSEQSPAKMKPKSTQSFKPSRPPRRLAVAPLRHPVLDLVGGHVENVTQNINENQKNGEINLANDGYDFHKEGGINVADCPEQILQESSVEAVSSERFQHASDLLKEESIANINCVSSVRNEQIPSETSVTANVQYGGGLVKTDRYKDKSLKGPAGAEDLGPKCQPKPFLDKDLYSWRERVKECGSFPSLPDKFRPLRRSVGNYGYGNSTKGDPYFNETQKVDDSSGESHGLDEEVVRFYLPGHKPDYLINTNTVVTRHPGQSKMHYTDSPKLSAVVRKYSLQESGGRRSADVVNDCDTRPEVAILNEERNDQSRDEFDDAGPFSTDPEPFVSSSPTLENVNDEKCCVPCDGPLAQDHSHYHALKETIAHLKLPTRRASTMAWRAQYVDSLTDGKGFHVARGCTSGQDDGPLTQERKENIDKSLGILRHELENIRQQDQDLAKQFLTIRHTINKLRWNAQCHSHEQLLEEVEDDIVELRDLSRVVVDTPTDLLSTTSFLRHFGLTRMNITSRRESLTSQAPFWFQPYSPDSVVFIDIHVDVYYCF
ncbi:hypothetical protein Btru_041958 [Bulinus truncatus]|nr:hypothetical protein Btru_041958 [Bulinus truncatus]